MIRWTWVKRCQQGAVVSGALLAIGAAQARNYGPAGCGLGSMIFAPDSGFTQIFAATTNGTSYSQTFGISSGTSNCADTSGGSDSAKAYVEANRVALAKDIARGSGETLEGLARLAGCRGSAEIGGTLQANFDRIFPHVGVTDTEVAEHVLEVLTSEPVLACESLVQSTITTARIDEPRYQ